MLPRQFATVKFGAEDLTWFYPHEIIDRLESLADACHINLDTEPREALALGEQWEVLDTLLHSYLVPALTGARDTLPAGYARLSEPLQRHFVHLLYSARHAARSLRNTQPGTPLGTPKGALGVYSNLLSASWIDLTEGGKIPVNFEPIA